MSKQDTRFGDKLIKELQQFLKRISDSQPIVATEVIREETPDGPVYIRKEVEINR